MNIAFNFNIKLVGFYPTPVSRALFEILTTRAASSRFSDGRWVESTNIKQTKHVRRERKISRAYIHRYRVHHRPL